MHVHNRSIHIGHYIKSVLSLWAPYIYVKYFTKAIIELVKKLTYFNFYDSLLTVKFNATQKKFHIIIHGLILNIKCVHMHKIVEAFNFMVFTHRQIKNSVKNFTFTVLHFWRYSSTCVHWHHQLAKCSLLLQKP